MRTVPEKTREAYLRENEIVSEQTSTRIPMTLVEEMLIKINWLVDEIKVLKRQNPIRKKIISKKELMELSGWSSKTINAYASRGFIKKTSKDAYYLKSYEEYLLIPKRDKKKDGKQQYS